MTAFAPEPSVHMHDQAVAFVANTQIFDCGEDFVEASPVPWADLAACADGRFVQPGG